MSLAPDAPSEVSEKGWELIGLFWLGPPITWPGRAQSRRGNQRVGDHFTQTLIPDTFQPPQRVPTHP